jgi:hypothetical protein
MQFSQFKLFPDIHISYGFFLTGLKIYHSDIFRTAIVHTVIFCVAALL